VNLGVFAKHLTSPHFLNVWNQKSCRRPRQCLALSPGLWQTQTMNRAVIINRIRSVQEALQAAGVSHAYLFGSLARGEQDPESDVDVAIDIAPEAKPGFTLLNLSGISILLEDELGVPVDVLVREDMRRTRANFQRDIVQVF
jgi:hypothetical protein